MKDDGIWYFVLGIGLGILIGGIIVRFAMGLETKFCPTCGSTYTDAVNYCEDDGALLKERGN